MNNIVVRKSGIINDESFSFLYGWAVLITVVLVVLLQSCTKDADGRNTKRPQPVVPVVAAMVEEKDVPVELAAPGQVEPYSTVSVKSQISGQLQGIHFKEGQDVQKGQLLFTIDPRPYQVALLQAEANYARDLAQMQNAVRDADRYEKLVEKDYIAKSLYDQYRTNADALAATVKADKAAIDNAKLQLSYCFIYSPVTGRTGSLLIHGGNLIPAMINDNTKFMVVINQIQPIYVSFSLSAQYLAEIKKYSESASSSAPISAANAGNLVVEAMHLPAPGGIEELPEKGRLTLIDNAVDTTTGTIHLKGTFDNVKKSLWPGEFINVKLILTIRPHAVVVPSQAIVTGQNAQFVYVIKSDQTVETRDVTTGITFGKETVIEGGLKVGEQVVTDGQLRLVSGSKINIKVSATPGEREPDTGKTQKKA